jgi:hypothetical protein
VSDDADLDRIAHIAEEGLKRSREEDEEDEETYNDMRLDTFAIVGVWAWKDEDGNDNEGYSIWSETRRTHVQAGILIAGLQRLAEGGGASS